MKTYAVSYICWTDNELTTEFIEASSAVAAMKVKLIAEDCGDPVLDEMTEIEKIKSYAFDCDCTIHAVEVPDVD